MHGEQAKNIRYYGVAKNQIIQNIGDNTVIKVTPFVKLIDGETTLKGKVASFTLGQLKAN